MPARRTTASPHLQALRDPSAGSSAQIALAQTVLASDKDVQTTRAALDVLKKNPTAAARPALRERYEYYAADGVKRDAGTYLRAAILQTLRPIALPDDLPLLERAAVTFEFLPPGRSEEAALLRSAALVTMDAVDPARASAYCIRLLADRYTSRLSGEPAVTAVRVLAAQGNDQPLYYYALHQPEPQSDVLSECLKNLAKLPPALATGLVEKYGATNDEVVLVGLLDMVLESGGGPFIHEFLTRTDKYAVYHYLVTRLMDRPTHAALDELTRQAQTERDPRKLALLEEALLLGRADPAIQAALAAVRASQKTAHRRPTRAQEDDDSD